MLQRKLFELPRRSFASSQKSTTSSIPCLSLRTGNAIPQLALGTWKSPQNVTRNAVEVAIRAGYTNIDTANDYNNEPEVGEAISNCIKSGIVGREDLFVQSKLWNSNHRAEHIRADLEQTLVDLQLDYIDSYVIHWPQACPSVITKPALRTTGPGPAHISEGSLFPFDDEGYFVADLDCHFDETWQAMQELCDPQNGLVRSIGLSNFNVGQIREVLEIPNMAHLPSVLQNECHPYLQQKDLIDFCGCNGILFQAFSSLGSGDTHLAVSDSPSGVIPLKDPLVSDLAKKYGKSNAQIVLRWHTQRGHALVTKSVNPDRIIENANIYDFELSDQDMKSFDSINYWWRHLYWRETSNHPDYPFHDELPYKYQLEKAPNMSSSGN